MSKDIKGLVSKISTWGGADMCEVTIRMGLEAYKDFHTGDEVTITVKEA
jgi:hypothetical protein